MKFSLAANPVQARQTKTTFSHPEEQLSYELGQAVQELPPIYTRLLAGTLSFIVFGTIGWAHFSQIDEVATASGELIPVTQVRPVTALSSGFIIAVKVKEGDRVTKDQILIQRDSKFPQNDVNRLAKNSQLIEDDLQRLQAERTGQKTAGTKLQNELLNSRLLDYQSQQIAAKAESERQKSIINQSQIKLSRLQASLVSSKTNVINAKTNLQNSQKFLSFLNKNLEVAQEREKNLQTLLQPGALPRIDYMEAQERLTRANTDIIRAKDEITKNQNTLMEAEDRVLSVEKEIAVQIQQIQQAKEAYQAAINQEIRLSSARKSEILTQINKRKEELTNVAGQLAQAKQQKDAETIKAPVTGTIYKVKATKGPVQSGEELLSILPEGEEIVLEVKVLNRDIGFIQPGMTAKVKLATFPFQEFGVINGQVSQISPNAVIDKELGLVFPTRIKLSKHFVNVRGQDVEFTPGMVANAEIVTRKKSILTFMVEPITKRFSEAFSVR